MREEILVKRRFLEIDNPSDNAAYLATKLYNQFGVFVDKPQYLSKNNVETIANFFGTKIPNGFYKNPQDLNFFTADELIIEQLISYFQIAINGKYNLNEDVFKRNEIFAKALPNYSAGEEIKVRKYELISKEQADKELESITSSFCKYTRPWSIPELEEFKWLYLNGFYKGQNLLCNDNIISLFLEYKDINFAKMLDKKDIVKMSLSKFGIRKKLKFSKDDKTIFALAINNAKDCALSLSQAKKFNAIAKTVGLKIKKENNDKSPYKKALSLLNNGDVVGAAKVFASYGSLLERNLVYLLSRANSKEANEIMDLIKSNNPIVLIQLLLGIVNDDYKNNRVFKFYYNKKLRNHIETKKEHKYRKSILSVGKKKILINGLNELIKNYYTSKESLGKIYISDEFKKIGLPLNTSAMGMGLDVLPTGSRLDIKADFIRTFCYWYNAFDIDASVIFVKNNGEIFKFFWGNYANKLFGEYALSSGDNRDENGAEFCDFRIKELKKLGYKYAIFVLNGFASNLNCGEIYCGYQNKKNLKTLAWDPKNIELKIQVKGESRAYTGFALDFKTNEVIILNQILDSNDCVVNEIIVKFVQIYLKKNFLENFNMYKLLSYRGELVENKEDADVVFANNYIATGNQKVISAYDIEKLVTLLK